MIKLNTLIKLEKNLDILKKQMRAKMKEAGIEYIHETTVKKFTTSGHILVPERFIGKECVIFIKEGDKKND